MKELHCDKCGDTRFKIDEADNKLIVKCIRSESCGWQTTYKIAED